MNQRVELRLLLVASYQRLMASNANTDDSRMTSR